MNILEAKQQVCNTCKAYLVKDRYGNYAIPLARQRPVLLIGAPGIGKTAIMEQVASELGVGLVSYSMTHHTRQSALGLPKIVQKSYGDLEYDITEYTMSEIISSIYDLMENTGVREGILFLDEINCVSETLAPSMLQFLQYKTFGRHKVPDGWVVCCAGNPPEYNRSVTEFDVVTLDRLKRIVVEPDYGTWREYAFKAQVHDAVISFLDLKKDFFYIVENTAEGKEFVTARGWVDLSDVMKIYEQEGMPIDLALIQQYVQRPQVAEEFALYYELYQRYRVEYGIAGILEGKVEESVLERSGKAPFDERLSVLSILVDAVSANMRETLQSEARLLALRDELRKARSRSEKGDAVDGLCERLGKGAERRVQLGLESGSLSEEELESQRFCALRLGEYCQLVRREGVDGSAAFDAIQVEFDKDLNAMRQARELSRVQIDNIFAFVEKAFGNGQELAVLMTELTARYYCSRFISKYGCDNYFKHNTNLLVDQRGDDLQARMRKLG